MSGPEDSEGKGGKQHETEIISQEDVLSRLARLHNEARELHASLDREWLSVRNALYDRRRDRSRLTEQIDQIQRVLVAWESLTPEAPKVVPLRARHRKVAQMFDVVKEREELLKKQSALLRTEKEIEALRETETMLTESKEAAYRRMRRIEEIQKNYLFIQRNHIDRRTRDTNET